MSLSSACNSTIFCMGALLHDVQLARPYQDSKEFVDMPTRKPIAQVLAAYALLPRPITNNTALNSFLAANFKPAGSELKEVSPPPLTDPSFTVNIASPELRSFISQVVDIWPSLTRNYAAGDLCNGCVSSMLPLNRTFVVAGGRFREQYYWDSYFILEGLLRTRGDYITIGKNIILNFLDFVQQYGFVPNGSRAYYLNRSQPPVLSLMVSKYVAYTNDTSFLSRALPLLEKEYNYWKAYHSVNVNTKTGTVVLSRYNVINSSPRPESYVEDYETANNVTFFTESGAYQVPALYDNQKKDLYAELATGAESGFDYSSRWLKDPAQASTGKTFPLRSLNIRSIVPVELNSILYGNEKAISDLYLLIGGKSEKVKEYAQYALTRKESMFTVLYDAKNNGYFDYNLTSNGLNIKSMDQVTFSPAQYFPFWTGAAHDTLLSNKSTLMAIFSPIQTRLDASKGSVETSNIRSGQQWDSPNVWAPLEYAMIQALKATEVPSLEQLGLRLAQRFIDSTFCTWRSTGGQIDNLPNLRNDSLKGLMFEKYSSEGVDKVGSGGEYKVVPGFGWTNGVVIWIADTYSADLTTPVCKDQADQKDKASGAKSLSSNLLLLVSLFLQQYIYS